MKYKDEFYMDDFKVKITDHNHKKIELKISSSEKFKGHSHFFMLLAAMGFNSSELWTRMT